MADLIKAQSPATAVFPDLGFSGDEVPLKKSRTLFFVNRLVLVRESAQVRRTLSLM